MYPSGINTNVRIPALAPYAAAEADVFPVEAQIIAPEPASFALETAIVIPRSLKLPVGLQPSNFK